MTFDIPHMIATMVTIFVVIWGLNQTSLLENKSKGRRILITFAVLFVALVILNLVWPYGTGA